MISRPTWTCPHCRFVLMRLTLCGSMITSCAASSVRRRSRRRVRSAGVRRLGSGNPSLSCGAVALQQSGFVGTGLLSRRAALGSSPLAGKPNADSRLSEGGSACEAYTRERYEQQYQPVEQQDPREQQRAAAEAQLSREPHSRDIMGTSYAYTRGSGGGAGGARVLGVPVRESWSLDPETAAALQPKQSPDLFSLS